jgi:hypothetical protein
MAAAANIVLNDGQATPVAHTFEPVRVAPDLVTYHDKVDGIVAGYRSITLGRRLPSAQNGNGKSSGRIRMPILETAATAASGFTPGPTVAYSLACNIDSIIPDRATLDERKDLYAYATNLLAEAVFGDLMKDGILPT